MHELAVAEGYDFASDHETAEERYEYIADMIQQDHSDLPARTPIAYKNKLNKFYRERRTDNEQREN